MSQEHFLASVLPSRGFRYLHCAMPDGRPVQRDFLATDVSDLLGFAEWAVSKQANVYFGVAAYMPVGGEMRRTQACARFHKCLRLDLDCGEGKDYATQREALQGLTAFLTASGLPMPTLVDSGYGLHVYWPFTADVERDRWQPLASRLHAACTMHGLRTDTTTTQDAARILRLPGTLNFKFGTSKPVRLLHTGAETPVEALEAALSAFPAAPALMLQPPPGMSPAPGNELSQGMLPIYFLRGVLTQCPGVRGMLADGGRRAREPLWKLALDLVNKSEDTPQVKERVARALSSGHPGFDEGAFQQKWAMTQRQDYHTPTCQKMADAGMPECAACPMRGSIRTPSALGRPGITAAAAPPPPPPPAGPPPPPPPGGPPPPPPPPGGHLQQVGVFVVNPAKSAVQIVDGPLSTTLCVRDGIPTIVAEAEQPDGTKRKYFRALGTYRFLEVERLLDRTGQQSITALTIDRNSDQKVIVELGSSELSSNKEMASVLYAHGVYIPDTDIATLRTKFLPMFLSQLQRARAANQIASRCGWTEDRKAFVLGTTLYSASAPPESVRPSTAPDEMRSYHEAGAEDLWRRAFDLTMAGGPDRQAVLALSIAAPLMVFSGVDGVMLNAYSPESGVGKSTLCDAALSLWGSPTKLRKDFRDTANATFKLAAVVGNLPMVVDEFTNVDGRALSDYVYTITQGREKHRMTSDAKLHTNNARWCLPTIVTGNNSIHDKLQAYRPDAGAEAARVFELRLHPLNVPVEVMGQRKLELLALQDNYGFLGPKLVSLYLARGTDYWQKIVSDRITWWDKNVSRDTGDRFRSVTAALIELGAIIGSAMGFAFDRAGIVDVVKRQWLEQQAEFEASRRNPEDFVNGYILDNLGSFAFIGGVNADALMSTGLKVIKGEVRGKTLQGRYLPQSVMVPQAMLRDYVREKNGNYKAVIEWVKNQIGSPTGVATRMGNLKMLEGQFQQITTAAIEFKPSILGASTLSVVSPPAATGVPPPIDLAARRP